jgi:hypothetical protein
MAGTPEGRVKKAVDALLGQHGAWHHKPVQNGMGKPALDYHVCHRGRYAAIETKAPGNKLTPRQELTKKEIEDAGGKVFVIGEHLAPHPHSYSGMVELEAWLLEPL